MVIPEKREIKKQQKKIIKREEREVLKTVEKDGIKKIQKVKELVDVEVPEFETVPVFDADGNPIMKIVQAAEPGKVIPAELDDEGNVLIEAKIIPAREEILEPETTRIPVMEEIEEVTPEKVIPSDGKIHFGFTAQDIAAALTEGGFDPKNCKVLDYGDPDDPDKPTGVIYAELTALLWRDHQALKAEVKALTARVQALETINKKEK